MDHSSTSFDSTKNFGPVELDPAQLSLVGGGSPKGTWMTETSSPKGTWSTEQSTTTEVSSPKGTW